MTNVVVTRYTGTGVAVIRATVTGVLGIGAL